jgi:hypothetical protein
LSNWKEDDTFDVYQAAWNGTFGQDLFIDGRVSYVDVFFPLYIKEEAKRLGLQSTLELTTNKRTGSNSQELIFNRHRFQAKAVATYFVERWLGGRHELKVGWDFSYNPNSVDVNIIDDVNLYTQNGLPAFVDLYNTPLRIKRNTMSNAVFAADSFLIGRLTVTVGARLENVRGWLPAQSSPAGNFAPARSFPEMKDIIDWTNVSPRIGFSLDLTGDGKTALKANVARYYYTISTAIPNAVNPNSLSGERHVWNDLNGDKKFQKGEEGALVSVFGGTRTSIDPNLKQPYTNELVLGFDRELFEDFGVSLAFTVRQDRRLLGTRNITALWIPTTITDPLTGNPITVYNQDRSTIGQERFLIVNADVLNIDYRGLDIVAQKRFSRRWQLLASLTLSRTVQRRVSPGIDFGTGAPSVDPNTLVNAKGRPWADRPVMFKLSGSYVVPKVDVLLGANLRVQSGQVKNRFVRTRLNQGFVTVFAVPPGTERYDTVTTLDLRASKIFRLPGGRTFEFMLDAYNLTNANTVLSEIELTGPSLGFPNQVLAPRILRIGARLQF